MYRLQSNYLLQPITFMSEQVNPGPDSDDKANATGRAKRTTRPFPAASLEESLTIPRAIWTHGAGKPVRRLTLFQKLDASPTSGKSRQEVTNASRYGLIKGSYASEELSLTEDGLVICNPDSPRSTVLSRSFEIAVGSIPPFRKLYDTYVGGKLPAREVLRDALVGVVDDSQKQECIDTFLANANSIGLVQVVAGASTLFSLEEVLANEGPSHDHKAASIPVTTTKSSAAHGKPRNNAATGFENTCFLICPIGDDGTEFRAHSDIIREYLIEPVMEEFGLTVVRADGISKPGMITAQILDYIAHSKLVIADLSFHNPNVFYELSFRHVLRRPTVQLIRSVDKIPFDLSQHRTVVIDTSLYGFRPREESYKAEIATQVRAALEDPDNADNPIVAHFGALAVTGI